MNGMMTGVQLEGTKIWTKLVTTPQSHFQFGSLDLVP